MSLMEPKVDTHVPEQAHGEFNLKTFMIAVVIAGIVVCAALLFVLFVGGTRTLPPDSNPHPTSRLILPSPSTLSNS